MVEAKYDRFTQRTTQAYTYVIDQSTRLIAVATTSEQVTFAIVSVHTDRAWRYLKSRTVYTLIDGKPGQVEAAWDGDTKPDSAMISESLVLPPLSIDGFKTGLASAASVEMRVGPTNFAMSAEGIAKLREFARSIPEPPTESRPAEQPPAQPVTL